MNISNYVWLVFIWALYGVLHSSLSTRRIKEKFKLLMKGSFKFYRILYSIFATIFLVLIIGYQYTIRQFNLWDAPMVETIISIAGIFFGLLIMIACTKKYFYNLSGIDAFMVIQSAEKLEQQGLHKFVRHPLYAGTLLFIWSLFLYNPTLTNLISCLCISAYTRVGIYFEEIKLVTLFGEAYNKYSKKVPMLFPNILVIQKKNTF